MKVLFMCVANSARSQMAEALARHLWNESVTIASAGSKPSAINPFAAKTLKDLGINTENLHSKSVDDLPASFTEGLDSVITLCTEEVCPMIVSKAKRIHWPLPDPAAETHDGVDKVLRFRLTIERLLPLLLNFGAECGVLRPKSKTIESILTTGISSI